MAGFLSLFKKPFQKDVPTSKSIGVGDLLQQRYRLEAELGRGGMGLVYRAKDIQNEREVAVKVINPATANALTLGQFTREAEITSRLNHPHIVKVFETNSLETETPYIVMELVKGKSLDEIKNLTYARIIDIATQICDALEHIHDQGFVYRDLKPDNVILEIKGFHYFVKLLDFGLARPRGEAYLPNESSLAGTVFYLAPELISGQTADVSSDLYALGALLYEMVTGRVPFSNFDEQSILSQHLEEKVPPPDQSRSDIPAELNTIILHLLEKDPSDRFANAGEVRRALENIQLPRAATPGNLPKTESNGKEFEIESIKQMLEAGQLVTILGQSEILAVTVGAQLERYFTDGVWLAELSGVTDPTEVLHAVAAALEITETSARPLTVSLIESLREKNLLLLISHCDHIRSASAQLIATIIRSCPEVRVLVTSKFPLNIPAEICYPESSLP